MIIQVRGSGGSGKTTVFRRVMEEYAAKHGPEVGYKWLPYHAVKRKQPLYYSCGNVIVLGHYESPCGGGDTIGSSKDIYELAKRLFEGGPGRVILVEGLLLSEDVKWTLQLPKPHVIYLTTPVAKCVDNIKLRRSLIGDEKPIAPDTATKVAVRGASIDRSRVRLINGGAVCRRASSDQAPGIILKWIEDYVFNMETNTGTS